MKYYWYRDLTDFLRKYEFDSLFWSFDLVDNVNAETINNLKYNVNKIVNMIRSKIVEEDIIRMKDANTICNSYKSGVEDVYHFICVCPNYSPIRKILSSKLKECNQCCRCRLISNRVPLSLLRFQKSGEKVLICPWSFLRTGAGIYRFRIFTTIRMFDICTYI